MILQDSLKMKQPMGPTTARAQPKNPQLCMDAWEQHGKATAAAYANHGDRNDRNISVPVHKYIYRERERKKLSERSKVARRTVETCGGSDLKAAKPQYSVWQVGGQDSLRCREVPTCANASKKLLGSLPLHNATCRRNLIKPIQGTGQIRGLKLAGISQHI